MFTSKNKKKFKDVENIIKTSICTTISASGVAANPNDRNLAEMSKKFTKDWLGTLPKVAIVKCLPATLASYALVHEAVVHKCDSEIDAANLYLESARLASRGMGILAASDKLDNADYVTLQITVESAQKNGFSFP